MPLVAKLCPFNSLSGWGTIVISELQLWYMYHTIKNPFCFFFCTLETVTYILFYQLFSSSVFRVPLYCSQGGLKQSNLRGQICEKIINLPGGQISDPMWGKQFFSPFLPATPSSQSLTLDCPFELTFFKHFSLGSIFH